MAPRLTAAVRRNQLLDVALITFSEHGFHSTSMNDIADDAGITKPVLYQHFGSKRALYLELLRLSGDRLTAAVVDATAKADGPRGQVEDGIEAYFQFVIDQQPAFWLLFGGGTRRDEEFAAETTRVEAAIADLIADLIEVDGLGGDQRVLLAHGVVGLAEGTSRHWIASGEATDLHSSARLVADLAWRGLRGVRTDP